MTVFDELSWDSWKEVPKALAAALKCVKPKEASSKDPSAKVSECVEGEDPEIPSGELRLGGSLQAYTMWNGDPEGLLGSGLPTWNPFLSPFDLAQSADPASLPGLMGDVASHHASPPGFTFTAEVTISHYSDMASDPDHVSGASLVGQIAADGRFDIVQTQPVQGSGGEPDVAVQRITFDGAIVQQLSTGSEAGNALTSTYPAELLHAAHLNYIEPVFWWATDPLSLPLFEGITFDEVSGADPEVVDVTRVHHGSSGSFPGSRWLVNTAEPVPHPYLFQALDSAGAVWEDAEFRTYLSRDGYWRPREIESTRFLNGRPDGARVVTEVKIIAGDVLSPLEASQIPAPWSEDILWQIWE